MKQPTSKLKLFFIALFFLFMAMILTYCNLEENYVYYYQHSPKTDKKGLPFVALDQLYWYAPEGITREGEYEYDRRFTYNTIVYDGFHFSQSNWPANSYILIDYSVFPDGKYYDIDNNFNLIRMSYYLKPELPFSEADEAYALDAITKVTQQVLEETEEPYINLQWLYDAIDWGNVPRGVRSGVDLIPSELE